MDLALALRRLWEEKLWLVPVVVLAIIGAIIATHNVSVVPPGLKSKSLESGAAKLGLILDARDSTIAPRDVSVAALAQRSVLYAELLKSQPVRKSIGRRTGVAWQTIPVDGQVENQPGNAEVSQPNQVQRSTELVNESSPWRIYFLVNSNYPIINLYAQAPTPGAAINLVQDAADSLADYTSDHQAELEVPASKRVKLLQLGDPQGGVVAAGANASIAVAVALAIILIGCFLILYISRVSEDIGGQDSEALDLLTAALVSKSLNETRDGETRHGETPHVETPPGEVEPPGESVDPDP